MIIKLYGIKDCKPGKFLNIFFADNDFAAQRDISDAIGSQDTVMSRHPEDFQLFSFGEIDTETGLIIPKVEFIENFVTLVPIKHTKEDDQSR